MAESALKPAQIIVGKGSGVGHGEPEQIQQDLMTDLLLTEDGREEALEGFPHIH